MTYPGKPKPDASQAPSQPAPISACSPFMSVATPTSGDSRQIHFAWLGDSTGAKAVEGLGITINQALLASDLLRSVRRVDVLFIEETTDEQVWVSRWRAVRAAFPHVLGILVAPTAAAPSLRSAMRERMFDVVCGADAAELRVTIQRCRKRAAELIENSRRERSLRRRCRKLSASRAELLRQIGAISEGVMQTYQGVADHMRISAVAAEFDALVRQELDIEGLLRTMLEFTLKKIGPTNGAIFLPTSCGDYSLGAYVNYDCPKDSAETLIGNLADSFAPSCEELRDLVLTPSIARLEIENIDPDHWLADYAGAVRSVWHEGECLAVLVFFRDQRTTFTDELRPVLSALTDLFGRQLARVIKVHHRHKPMKHWGGGDSLAA